MAEFNPIRILRPKDSFHIPLVEEARLLSSYRNVAKLGLIGSATHLRFSPVAPYELAVSHNFNVSLINPDGGHVRKTLTRFRDFAYSPDFKQDGRLLVAGAGDGTAQVFDVANRSVLRAFRGHQGAVRTSKFTGDGLRVLTGSDDKTVKVWDLATATSLFTLNDATDYVRSQSASPAAHHVWMTGSSDRKARLYDLRSRNCIFVLDHASQVDDVHILPGGARAVTIGGPDVKLWDFFAGGKVSKKLTCHAKAVTCGAVNTEHGYFATGGLDGFLKVHDISTLETKGVLSFPSQILSIDISKDGQRFAAGMESGALEIRASEKTASRVGTGRSLHPFKEREFEGWGRGFARVDEDSSKPFPGSARYFNRGKGEKPMDDTDVIIERSSMLKLADHDKHLKQFSFGRALDAAVCTKKPKVVVAIVEELIIRGNLRGALSCRSLKELLPIMGVIKRNIRNPVYSDRLTYLMNIILDMYAEQFGVDEEADKLLKEILMQVKKEVKTGRDMSVLRGAAESVVTVSNMS